MIKRWIAAFAAVICSFLGIYDYGEEQIAQGYELLEAGEYAAANEEFESALAQAEETSAKKADEKSEKYIATQAYQGLGMSSYELEEYQKCVEYLKLAIEEGESQTAMVYDLLGISSMKLDDYESAVNYFEQGLTLETDVENSEKMYKEMRYNKVVCYEQLADWEAARTEAEAFLALYPEDEEMQKEYTFLKTR